MFNIREKVRRLREEARNHDSSSFYSGVRYALDVLEGKSQLREDDEDCIERRQPYVEVEVPQSGPINGRKMVRVNGADSFFVTPSGCLVVKNGVRSMQAFATATWMGAEVK